MRRFLSSRVRLDDPVVRKYDGTHKALLLATMYIVMYVNMYVHIILIDANQWNQPINCAIDHAKPQQQAPVLRRSTSLPLRATLEWRASPLV